jgi:hypothetical protein
MTDQVTDAEALNPLERRCFGGAASPMAAQRSGSERTEFVASSNRCVIASRFGINARDDVEHLRKSGEDFAWRHWKPFHG